LTDEEARAGLRRELDVMMWDIDQCRFVIRLKDGRMFQLAAPPNYDPERAVARATYFWHARHLVLETKRGDQLLALLPSRHNVAPVDGRPVIYLDQNHWSTLAKMARAPQRVPQAERTAAQGLIALARAGKVILPVSAGHHTETSQWLDDDSRYQLGCTMLQLSKGWQMRDPIGVWAQELQWAISTEAGLSLRSPSAVFTLEPWAIHDDAAREREMPDDPSSRNFPVDVEFAFQATLSTLVNFDLLLNTAAIRGTPSTGWRDKQQQTTNTLGADKRHDAQQKRGAAFAFALDDMSREMAKAAAHTGISTQAFETWVRKVWNTNMTSTPAVAMFRSMFIDKHLDPHTRWENNDLTDLFYLSAAAGYADHIVAEKRTTGLITQSLRRLDARAKAHRNIAELMIALTPVANSPRRV
jgi:hypothetical protein